MNVIEDFYNRMASYLQEKADPKPYTDWLQENTKLAGLPFSVAKYPFQRQILNDMHTNLCCVKPSQVGLTEVQVRKALAIAARNPHRTVMFTLPTEDMRKRLYQTRVENLIKNTPIFNPVGQKPARSIEISQILESYVLMVPVTEAAATSQPADVVFNDEVDLSDQPLLALFNSRMQGSNWKMSQRFSTPTYDGFGISEDFSLSDQHYYMYKCHKCGHIQHPEFNHRFVTVPNLPEQLSEDYSIFENDWIEKYNLNLNDAYLHCEICRTPMNLKEHSNREWVAKYPNRKHHRGYKVSPFSVSTLPPSYIFSQLLTYRRNDNLKGWYNTVLGLPYEGGDERLSRLDILACFTEMTHPIEHDDGWFYFIGSDMGNLCHITVGRSRDGINLDLLAVETVTSDRFEERILALKDKYMIDSGYVDRFPLTETVNRVRDKSDNVIVPLQYQHTKGGEKFRHMEDELGNLSHASVQRTWHLDQLVTKIRNRRISISGYGAQKELIIEHLRDMVRESKDEEIPVWKKLNGKDHYFHSFAYCTQAMIQFFDGKNASSNSNSTLYLGGINVKFPAASSLGLFGNTNLKRGNNNGGTLL